MANVLAWADVPVKDMDRACKFYGALLQVEMTQLPGGTTALPAAETGPIAFDLTKNENLTPCANGVTIYLDSYGDIDGMVERATAAGGTLQSPPTDMGPMVGVLAFVIDTEGNRIGLRKGSEQHA
jgi:uncharacterized protein